jgi:PAS domain-containing protein
LDAATKALIGDFIKAQAIEASELGIWDWNLATDECTDNDTWWRMFGYAPGELPSLGETWRQLCHPEDWPIVTAALEGALVVYRAEAINLVHPETGERRFRAALSGEGAGVTRDSPGQP